MIKTTIEECPICKNPEAECEHLGNHQHFWHCDDCDDDWLAVVGYDCEVCPTKDAGDLAKAESEKCFMYGVSLGIANSDDNPPSA